MMEIAYFKGSPSPKPDFIEKDLEVKKDAHMVDKEWCNHRHASARFYFISWIKAWDGQKKMWAGEAIRADVAAWHFGRKKTVDGRVMLYVNLVNPRRAYSWEREEDWEENIRDPKAPVYLLISLKCGGRLLRQKRFPLVLQKGDFRCGAKVYDGAQVLRLADGSILNVRRCRAYTGNYAQMKRAELKGLASVESVIRMVKNLPEIADINFDRCERRKAHVRAANHRSNKRLLDQYKKERVQS